MSGKMTLKDLRYKAFSCAKKQGFHDQPANFAEQLMLIVSELSEALEADRDGRWAKFSWILDIESTDFSDSGIRDSYEKKYKGTVEEEIADAVIRLFDLAGLYHIDLDWHVRAKMAYNETRPYLHGKKY